ncbi:MAG: NAD(P)H-dependent glycerol-3-phosphate dehydrogenase [Bradymonadia bacterium]
MKATVIGGGSWGTALASVLAQKDDVCIWAREPDVVEGINTQHRNPRYQSDHPLPERITATTDIEGSIDGAEMVVMVVPSHVTRLISSKLAPHIKAGTLVVCASKGIENDSLETMEEVLTSTLPRANRGDLAFLSGPSFAAETLQQMATAVTIAARYHDVAEQVQQRFSTPYFRCYTTEDVTGVELGGALKNVIAIAAGAADGLGLGYNTTAALLTRGLAEISRLAVSRGANPLTLSGLSGMGDLVLTCTGSLSRNRRVGTMLGKGMTIEQILESMSEVAEGVKTAKSVYNLSRREGVEMPISEQVYQMIYEGKPAAQALTDLMGRRLKREREGG